MESVTVSCRGWSALARASTERGSPRRETPNSQALQNRHDHRTRGAPLADRVDREQLAIGEVCAETEAHHRERHRGEPGRLVFRCQQRGHDDHVADQAHERHGHADELGVDRGLYLQAAAAGRAYRLDAGVVDVGQVASRTGPGRATVSTIIVSLRVRALISSGQRLGLADRRRMTPMSGSRRALACSPGQSRTGGGQRGHALRRCHAALSLGVMPQVVVRARLVASRAPSPMSNPSAPTISAARPRPFDAPPLGFTSGVVSAPDADWLGAWPASGPAS